MKSFAKITLVFSLGYIFYWVGTAMNCFAPKVDSAALNEACFTGEFHWVWASVAFAVCLIIISAFKISDDL